MTEDNLKEVRLGKLEKLKALGINPFPYSYNKTHTIAQARDSEGKTVSTAGRMMSYREHGNIAFADLVDETGRIQIFFQRKVLGDSFKNLKLLDIGDFIGVEGEVGKTVAGEISVIPSSYTLLSKSLRPLPNEWYGLKDTETRYRQRYLDFILNPEVRERFNIRTKVISGVREYLDSFGFWEVETPVLQPLYGGANAKPFTTHLNALNQMMYLRIAVELYIKRLLTGGYEKVYEIAKNFRNEGVDQTHSPEFTMVEWYEAYVDYNTMMDRAEGLLKFLATKIFGTTMLQVEDKKIDIGNTWPRITMSNILKEKLNLDVDQQTRESLLDYLKEKCPGSEVVGSETKGQLIFMIFDHLIPKTLKEPTWIIDYPQDISPFARPHQGKEGWAERFEGYIGGKEIFDGWTEITDARVQRKAWEKDTNATRLDKEEAQHVDEDYLTAMEYGMPPYGGIGVGIDRLTMLFTNTWAIKELILFPTLKRDKTEKEELQVTQLNKPEIFSINPLCKKEYPSLAIGTAVIKGVKIQKTNPELEKEKQDLVASFEGLTTEQIGEFPEIKSYRKLYKAMGVDWHSRRPSPEALLRRIALGKGLYTVNTVVDAYNLVVMKYHISAGAFDFDNIVFPTQLSIAQGEESIFLLGDEEKTQLKAGEVMYFDTKGPFNLDFNYRDAQRTMVTEQTTNIYVNVDGVYDISPQQVEKVLREVCDLIIKYNGGKVEVFGVETALLQEEKQSDSIQQNTSSSFESMNVIQADVSNVKLTRDEAFSLLQKYMQSPNLIKHSLAAEAAMKGIYEYLYKEKEDEKAKEVWGITGLLHDIDYEVAQKEEKLELHGRLLFDRDPELIEEPIQRAIKAHNYTKTGTDPETDLDWSISCMDQLTGLVVSSALIHPDKKLASIDPEFVLKRFNTPGFSKGVDRENIRLCEIKLGIPLFEFITIALTSMQKIAPELGL